MAVENYPSDPATDALAHFLKTQQSPDGRWRLIANRPPLGSSEFEVTAVAMRALQAYGPKPRRDEYEKSVRLAASWLQDAEPKSTPDRAFQLLGLRWAGVKGEIIDKCAGELLSKQRPDGGWGQLLTLASDAYATGQVLIALNETGAITPTEPAYQRGVDFII
jgi:squalene cyclase